MKRVVVLKIDDYDKDILKKRIEETLARFFPVSEYFSPQDKILLKPNLLSAASPDEAITTHPAIVEVVGLILKEKGFDVSIADSPGGFASYNAMTTIYSACGIEDIASRHNFHLLSPKETVVWNNLPLCWWSVPKATETVPPFKIINLAKLKTHELMGVTLATKNLYGCISGLHKSALHFSHPNPDDLAELLIELNKIVKPSLNIVDGILAMEGNGPAHQGSPRKLGVVVIGNDALYTDYVISRFLAVNDAINPLIKKAKAAGLICDGGCEIISELDNRIICDFKMPTASILKQLPPSLLAILKLILNLKPIINHKKCTKCLVCAKVCPAKAISVINNKVRINYKKCIKCMCCVEMCQFAAVKADKGLLMEVIAYLYKLCKNNKNQRKRGCHGSNHI